MRIVRIIALLTLGTGMLCGQLPLQTLMRLSDTLSHLQQIRKYKGLSAAVHIKGQGSWSKAVGLSKPSENLDATHAICIGSNTKTFLAAAVLQLVERGVLSLDDSVGKWLSPIPNIKGSITLRQLMSHTSGLFNYTTHSKLGDSVNANPYRVWTKEELVKYFVDAPLFTPGNGWSYSNTNFLVAGLMAENATGIAMHQYIRDSILDPLQLKATFSPPHEQVTSPFAGIWTNIGYGYLSPYAVPDQFYSIADVAGGMVSDASDNSLFWQHLMQGHIISKKTLRQDMMKWVVATGGLKYGLGLMREVVWSKEVFSHGGAILGQLNSNLADTVNGIYVTVLTNQDSVSPDPVRNALYRIALSELSRNTVGITERDNRTSAVYPNPATSVLYLGNDTFDQVTIETLEGRIVKCLYQITGSISVADLPEGLYVLHLRSGADVRVTRFAKAPL